MMVRLDDEAHQIMQQLAVDTQIAPAVLARAAVLTMLMAFQKHRRIEFPLRYWEPAARADEGLRLEVAEEPGGYGTERKKNREGK